MEYQSSHLFHGAQPRVYNEALAWAVNKRHQAMAKVLYEPAHPNPNYTGPGAGQGRTYCTWVFSEEPETREGIHSSGLELFMDTRLDPGASVGRHLHYRTEEVYYILEGSLQVTTFHPDFGEITAILGPGDAHSVRPGQSHQAQAGKAGARFITVALRS